MEFNRYDPYDVGYSTGYQDGHAQGNRDGYVEGWTAFGTEVEPRIAQLYVEMREMEARISLLESKLK